MNVIELIRVNDSMLQATNVAENDYGVYDESTTYNLNDRAIDLTTHRVYESQVDGNLGNDPTTDDGTNWLDVSATNRWKAFDSVLGDTVTQSGSIEYTIRPDSSITGVYFFGLNAQSVRVRVVDPAGPTGIYDETKELVSTGDVVDWFSFFFSGVDYEDEMDFFGIPGYAGYDVHVIIDAGGGTAAVSQILLGEILNLGDTLEGTSIGIEDFSRKERDDFGNATIVERAFIDRHDFIFRLETNNARRVKRILARLRATPALYYSHEGGTLLGTAIFGFPTDFSIPLNASGYSTANLQVEGLT